MFGAGGENRTPNLLITSQLPYHWATPATDALFGVPGRIRTLTSRFGGCRAAIDTTDTGFGSRVRDEIKCDFSIGYSFDASQDQTAFV